MSVATVQLLYALLASAGALFLLWAGTMAVASLVSEGVAASVLDLRDRFERWAIPAAFTVAFLATLGSLYFSEVAMYEPCRLCWYQRVAMYPLVPILAVATWRRDPGVRWYAIPVAGIGAIVSGYHYVLEWFPAADAGACKVGVPCTLVWFRELGFVTLPFLALTAFLLVIVLLLIPARVRAQTEDPAEG